MSHVFSYWALWGAVYVFIGAALTLGICRFTRVGGGVAMLGHNYPRASLCGFLVFIFLWPAAYAAYGVWVIWMVVADAIRHQEEPVTQFGPAMAESLKAMQAQHDKQETAKVMDQLEETDVPALYWPIGTRVKHPKFGEGAIVRLNIDLNDYYIEKIIIEEAGKLGAEPARLKRYCENMCNGVGYPHSQQLLRTMNELLDNTVLVYQVKFDAAVGCEVEPLDEDDLYFISFPADHIHELPKI